LPRRRILVVDDDRLQRTTLRGVLEREGWDVVGEAGDGRTAVDMATTLMPDVVLMDLDMPVMNGVEATRQIRGAAPKIEVVVLTVFDDRTVFEALRAGAGGYLLKGTPLREIVTAIEQALEGGSPISPRVARLVLASFAERSVRPAPAAAMVDLTPREREILALLVDGETSASLAASLGISLHTANAHIRSIYRKLEVRSRSQAVSRALRDRLV
jgi:DNA-binding NarL/FixJ family response regulator